MQSDASIQQDLKLQEILSLNLPKVWREIAIAIGPDNFVKIWRIASTPELCNTDNKLYVPSINKYIEYQRLQILTIEEILEGKKFEIPGYARGKISTAQKQFVLTSPQS